VHIPRIFWDVTTSRVLTLERIILKMVFEDGFFHADPHLGNFFVEPGGHIGLIDFGLVGVVDDHTQEHLVRVLLALTSQDADRLVDAFLQLGVTSQHVDRALLREDLEHLVSRYYGQALEAIALGPLLRETLVIARRHHLRLPTNLALLLKTVMMNEGLGVQLDPDFRLTTVLIPYAQRLTLRQYSQLLWTKRLGQASMDAAWLGTELPQQLRRLLDELERGTLTMSMRPTEMDPVIRRLERLGNRIVLGIILAAFITGLAMLMASYHPAGWNQWIFFLIGFALAGLLAVALAWSMLRPRRHER
jgi:ubiquinone biosynthesis protein